VSEKHDKLRQVRERTGQGWLDCQRALAEAGDDVDRAVNLMRRVTYTADAKQAFNALIERFKKEPGAGD
jgi:elongation factor Ts